MIDEHSEYDLVIADLDEHVVVRMPFLAHEWLATTIEEWNC